MTEKDTPEKPAEVEDTDAPKEDAKFLAIVRERFRACADAEYDIRKAAVEDFEFRAGKQWHDQDLAARTEDGRPSLVNNRVPQFVHQITNEQRQNRPAMKVSPVDSAADVETAKIRQGMIRHIEYDSNADSAYDTAFEHSAIGGIGYFRLVTEYCDAMSFDQDIKIKRVRDWASIYLDPMYKEPDGSDAEFGFVVEDLTFDDFKRKFPQAKIASMDEFSAIGNEQQIDWCPGKDIVRIAEYFYKEYRPVKLVLFSDGTIMEKSQTTPEMIAEAKAAGNEVVKERTSQKVTVCWAKVSGLEVLEKTTLPGQYIPLIPVIGDELIINGKRILEGIVRHVKDPQRMYNYFSSCEAEAIALAPRAPFIGVEGQFEGHELKWRMSNKKNLPYLEYNQMTLEGVTAPPPTRNAYEPPVQAMSMARMQSADDMKATTGIYDAGLGNKSNETSGRAIDSRNRQSQTANFHRIDNLRRSIRHGGIIINEWIPHVYDTERAMRIIGEDGEEDVVTINRALGKDDKENAYDMSIGKFDVTMDTGPSFATKRIEASEHMLDLLQKYPQSAPAIADLMVKNMDWPGAKEIAERLRKLAPPGMIESEKDKEIPPEVQAQLQQMGQMVEALTGQLNAAHDAAETKKAELDSKERIEMKKLEVQSVIKLAELESGEATTMLKLEIGSLQKQLALRGAGEPTEIGNEAGLGHGMAAPDQLNQPTGGPSPGEPMGVNP